MTKSLGTSVLITIIKMQIPEPSPVLMDQKHWEWGGGGGGKLHLTGLKATECL